MTDLVQKLESAVLTQLHGARGLCSLQIQNHIYGCYILMEDIAMSHVTLTGTTVSAEEYSFDIEKGFSEIGLRYGFLMDTKLELDTYLAEYNAVWMRCFTEMGATHDVAAVDKIEDTVNAVVHRSVSSEEGFFMNAVENGALTKNWVDKALRLLRLLRGGDTTVDAGTDTGAGAGAGAGVDADTDTNDRVLSHAHIEKPITHEKKRLSGTRRNKERCDGTGRKDYLHKTRRRPHTAVTKN